MLKGCQKLQKHLMEILLFLIFLPIVSASSFTGSFNDYGKHTDSDGLFNYLTIEAGAYITPDNNYIIFGRLEDSEGNFIEYEDCRSLTTGNYNFILDFDGRQIYRNRVDGPYTLAYIELSSVNDCDELDFPTPEDSLENAYTTSFYEYKEFQKGEAAVYCNSSPCTASSNLIKSRDNINNTPESNAPNTIDGCEDGLYGTYLDTESIESITVTSLNNSFFQVGDIIKVDITVYCDEGSDDKLNFVYSNDIDNIQWEVKDNKQCSSNGIQTFSTTFALDNNVGKHAIRGVFSFTLEPTTVCGQDETDDTSYWVDNDDVVIYVRDSEDQGKYKIDLKKGWNLLSLPKIEDNDIDAIANIFNNFDKIVALKNGNWYIYDGWGNSNLDELFESDGFWIKVNDNLTILIKDESALYTSFNLIKGWNLIGYPSMEQKDVNELFQNVMDDIELIYVYNDEFESFNPKNPSNFLIKPGMGIFVKIKNNALWYFNSTYTKNKPQESFNLNLTEGWNLVSIPLTSDKTTSQIFGTNKLYYLENQKWKQLEGNDEIDYSYSYWIKADESSLLIEGDKINNLNYDINQGWNLVNYPLTTETNTDVFFQNVIGNIESITSFENGEWKSFNPSKPNGLNSLTVLKPGKGIFVKAKDNDEWHFDGNELVAT